MGEERTAEAALAIERYVAGLRAELTLVGSVESRELAADVSAMLLDAARTDPERAFAEMERLGEPSELAAALLAERGIAPEGGVPSASWLRMGLAATIDILFALGLLILAATASLMYSAAWSSFFGPGVGGVLTLVILVMLLLGLCGWFAWRMWAPWRTGGRSATPGMALADVAVVRLGGSRTAVRRSDLAAAGLEVPALTRLSAAAALALAVLVLAWAVTASLWLVSNGALDPSGSGLIARFAGPESSYGIQVESSAKQLYGAAEMGGQSWPLISDETLDPVALKQTLVDRFATSDVAEMGAFTVGRATEGETGIWTVPVSETPRGGVARNVVLTYGFRLQWMTGVGAHGDWILTDYQPAH
jgi:hypothetical protein